MQQALERTKLETLFESGKNVFTIEDLAIWWQEIDYKKVKELARYYSKQNRLFRVAQGIYSLIHNPNELEIAQKLATPGYISYHTALSVHGINFQWYSEIHCISLRNRQLQALNKTYIYHQIKTEVLFNPLGLIDNGKYTIASPERAICDSLYLNPNLGFDNLRGVDQELIMKIAEIYNNKALITNVQKLFD